LWIQPVDIIAHARGGTNDPGNWIITCAPSDYSHMSDTFAEVALADPRGRAPIQLRWDGLERFR